MSFYKTASKFIGLTALFGAVGCSTIPVYQQMHNSPAVPLTPGEKTLVKSIFGNSVDTSIVRKHFVSSGCVNDKDKTALTYDTENILFCKDKYHEPDYSKATDIFNFGLFIHEMTHIWQFQAHPIRIVWDLSVRAQEYDYSLYKKAKFENFSTEQQDSIITNYARRFLRTEPSNSRYYVRSDNIRKDTTESDALLQKIVERQFPDARNARLAMEKKRNAVTHRGVGSGGSAGGIFGAAP